MSESKLTLTLMARDLASKEVNKLSTSLGGVSKSSLLAGIGIAGVVGFLGDAAKAAADEQVNIARLDTSLKANIANWDGNTKAIEDTISKREDLAFSDDELRGSLSTLVGATHDVNKAFAIQQTAMDLARYKNISLEDASNALIKVEGGHYRALQQLGIQISSTATQTEALAAVQKVASGQAAAYADTEAGHMKRLGIAWQDFIETLGGYVLIIPDVISSLGDTNIKVDAARSKWGSMNNVVSDSRVPLEHWKQVVGDLDKSTGPASDGVDSLTSSLYDLQVQTEDDITAMSKALGIFARYKHILSLDTAKGIGGGTGPKKHPKAFAEGGFAKFGELAMFGEHGPELGIPKPGGYQVLTAAKTKAAMQHGTGSGGSVHAAEGFYIRGVSMREIVEMVDRGLYFKLSRSAPSAVRK